MDLFETQNVVKENTLIELKKYLMPKKQKMLFLIMFIIICFSAVIGALLKNYLIMGSLAVLAVVLILEYRFILNRTIKVNIQRMRETMHADEYKCSTSFCEEGFKIKNEVTNGTIILAYRDLRQFVETKNFYAVFTKTHQFGIVNKEQIAEAGKREELFSYLNQRCKDMEWKIL